MLFDDYSSYSGCRKAVDEHLCGRPDVAVLFDEQSIAIRKVAAAPFI
jgi:hypothetical protein